MLTPYLAIDLDNLEKNIRTMAEITRELGVNLRPHFKTHKSPLIAHKQLSAGAIGITCANLGEAEVAVKSGIKDILISREIAGNGKLSRLAGLTRHADVKVVVDDPVQVKQLGTAMAEAYRQGAAAKQSPDQNREPAPAKSPGLEAPLGVLVEINIGQNRCGLNPDNLEDIIALVKLIDSHPHLDFRGFQGYEGHLVLLPDEKNRITQVETANTRLLQVVGAVAEAGYPSGIVTGGGTGTTLITGKVKGMTEIQPGTYATMDAAYSKIMGHMFAPAVQVVTTVISKPDAGRLILDAGSKGISTDYGPPEVIGHPDWVYQAGGDEYGILRHVNGEAMTGEIGEEINLYPSHGCTTFNLYNTMYGFRNNKLEIELPVAGRGKTY